MVTISKIKEKFYNFMGVNKKNYSSEQRCMVNKFIYELCNMSLDKVASLSEEETYLLRKKLGIIDFEVFQFEDKFDFSDKSYYMIRNKYSVIKYRLRDFPYLKANNKMTPVIPERFKNYYISYLGLDYGFDRVLRQNGINTLEDLLSYSKGDLLRIRGLGATGIKQIEESINKLGFKFIDDISDVEKHFVIANSSRDEILRSSLNWVNGFTDREFNLIAGRYVIPTIGDYYEHVKKYGSVSDNVSGYLSLIGLDDVVNDSVSHLYDYDNETLTRINLSETILNEKLVLFLTQYGVKTLGDLLSLHYSDLEDILFNNKLLINKVIDYVHSMGYFFRDEAPKTLEYCDSIVHGLSKSLTK